MLQAAGHTVPAAQQHPWLAGSKDSAGGKDSRLGYFEGNKVEAWVHFSRVDS